MPYIPAVQRSTLANGDSPETPGELTYLLTRTIQEYRDTNGDSYATFNDILGALDGCGREFYRRVVAPYEDTKIAENGDVY